MVAVDTSKATTITCNIVRYVTSNMWTNIIFVLNIVGLNGLQNTGRGVMGNTDESIWIAHCPKCGDSTQSYQVPVTFETLRCTHCQKQALPPDKHGDQVLYYHCLSCGQHYLTPKIDGVDLFESSLP